jgi:alpha-tubulin suppressor-like RCC1 family protein
LGDAHSCVIDADRSVRCFGDNSAGQLGAAEPDGRSEPGAPLSGLRAIEDLTAGWRHGCALGASLWCWGNNFYGQLGDGTDRDRFAPVAVDSSASFDDVEAGLFHSCATSAGALYCWGRGDEGQLGNGRLSERQTTPTEIATLEGVVQDVALGRAHTCALVGDGEVLCFGDNEWGQLGVETPAVSATPVVVDEAPPLRSIAAGYFHTCGLTSEGALYCWGASSSGQIHEDAASRQMSAFRVPGRYAQVSLGDFHTCAMTRQGEARCWGQNMRGQLGDGTTEDRGVPTPVGMSGQR